MRSGIAEHPGAELFLDELLLFAGGQRRFLVDHALLAVAVIDRVVDRRRLHVQRQFQKPGAVGTLRPELGRGSHGRLGGIVRIYAPDGIFLQMADRYRGRLDVE